MEHAKLVLAKIGFYFSLSAIPAVWLGNIDFGLRVILSGCGIIAAIYSIRYHRQQLKNAQKDK